mgnify:CR=1 FL=1
MYKPLDLLADYAAAPSDTTAPVILAGNTEQKKQFLGPLTEAPLMADANNAYIEVNAGAGGTESQDWAEMLFRMYARWAERKGYKVETVEYQAGEQAVAEARDGIAEHDTLEHQFVEGRCYLSCDVAAAHLIPEPYGAHGGRAAAGEPGRS